MDMFLGDSRLMKCMLYLGLVGLFFNQNTSAVTSYYNNLSGNYFDFKSISEKGAYVPASSLDTPTLVTNPYDGISFRPSAFVAVESQLGTVETKTVSSELEFLLSAKSANSLGQLTIHVAGMYYENPLNVPGASPYVTTSLSLSPINFTIGGVTRSLVPNFQVNRNNGLWSGMVSLSRSDIGALFNSPAMQISELKLNTTASVSATAQYATANSYLTDLSFVAQAIPEPSVGSLLGFSGFVLLFRRKTR